MFLQKDVDNREILIYHNIVMKRRYELGIYNGQTCRRTFG